MIRVSRVIIVMQLNKIKLSLVIHKATINISFLRNVFAIIQFGDKTKSHIAFTIQQTSIYKSYEDIF